MIALKADSAMFRHAIVDREVCESLRRTVEPDEARFASPRSAAFILEAMVAADHTQTRQSRPLLGRLTRSTLLRSVHEHSGTAGGSGYRCFRFARDGSCGSLPNQLSLLRLRNASEGVSSKAHRRQRTSEGIDATRRRS
jgi:hypothetical protein